MPDIATPATTPTAPSTSSTSSGSSAPSSNASNSGAMSTADFRRNIAGRATPSSREAEPTVDFAAQSSSDDTDEMSASDDISDDSDSFAEQSADEQAQQSDEGDWSWAEPLSAYRDGVHGVATAELLQALANGELPEALFDKLSLTMKDGDEEWTGNIADLRNGAQMHANFTKKSQAFAQEKKQFETERSELVDYFRSWKEDETGEKGLLGLEKMLGEDGVLRVAQRLAERLQRKEQLEEAEKAGHIPPGTAQIIMEREALQRQLEEAQRFKARQEQQAEQADINAKATALGQRINKEAVSQFKQAGLTAEDGTLTSGIWNLFKQELSALWTDANRAPSPTEIRTAVLAAKQQSDRIVKQDQAERAARAAKQGAKPAVTGAAPAGAPGAPKKSAGSGNKAMSTKDFKNRVMNSGRPFGGR